MWMLHTSQEAVQHTCHPARRKAKLNINLDPISILHKAILHIMFY